MTVRVLTGDCLEIMRAMDDATVDAVVTDPPYCSGGFTESARRSSNGSGLRSETRRALGWFGADNMGTSGLVWLMRSVAVEVTRLLVPNSSALFFTDWRMVSALQPAIESVGLRYQNMIVWDKGVAGLGFGFRTQHEIILHFTKGAAKYHDASAGNVITTPRTPSAGREHQTQKPVELMARLIRVVAPLGGLVLDPFAGSGTTGVAAIQEGRSFLGIERDADFVSLAERRLAEARGLSHPDTVQPSMFAQDGAA